MDKRAVAAVAGEMWEPAFGAGFQAPRANQESQVSYSSRPPSARHFHSKAANSAHFLRNRVFGLSERLKSSFSRKRPETHPSSDSCAEPEIPAIRCNFDCAWRVRRRGFTLTDRAIKSREEAMQRRHSKR